MSVSSPPILKILSDLDIDLIDVNNDVDYLRALMEATNALVITNASDKRIPVLQKEIKRVRADRKKADPKFNQKVKKTIVSPQKIMGQKMLPPAKLDPKKLSSQGGGGDTVSQILVSVTSIRDILVNQIKQKRDDAKKKRRATENVKRKDKETGLEILKKGFGAVKSGAEKVIAPVKSLFKEVLEFIGKVVFGRVLFKLFEWFTDKKNQDKVKAIGKFLKKTWPVLLASYLLFGNAFGRMAVKLGVMITKFSIRLVTKIIPALVKAIAKMKMGKMGKAGLIAGGIMAVGTAGYMMTRGGKDKEESEVSSVTPRNFDDLPEKEKEKYNEMMEAKGFNKGGPVPGSGNTDTVPAMLTPGEFVMSKGAVEKYGVKTLEGMNAAAGGTNKPQLKRVPHFNEGGKVQNRGIVTDPAEKARIEAETLAWVNKERVEYLGLPPLDKISYADGVELTKPMGKEFYGAGITEESSDDWNFDTMTRTTTRWKQRGSEMIFEGGEEIITEEQKQAYLDSNPLARMAMELKDQAEMDALGADISASAKMKGGGLVQGFQGGGHVQSLIDEHNRLKMESRRIKPGPNGKFSKEDSNRKGQLILQMNKLRKEIQAIQKSTSRPTVTPKESKTKTGSGLFGGIKRVVGGTADQLTGNLFDFDKRSGGGLIRKTAGAVGGLFGGGKKGGGGSSGILGPIGNVDDMVNKDKYKAPPKTDAVKKTGGSSGILGPISSDHSKMVNKDKYKVNPPVKKSVVQAYEEEKSKIVALGGGGGNTVSKSKGGNDLPNIDAAEKRSVHKIKTLGISV